MLGPHSSGEALLTWPDTGPLASGAALPLLLENSPLGIGVAEMDGRLTAVNPAFRQAARTPDLVGRNYVDLVAADDRPALRELLAKASHKSFQVEHRWERPGSAQAWLRVTVSPIPDACYPPRLLALVVEDISERRQKEEDQRRLEFYLAESQRLSQVGTWVWSASTRKPVFWSRELYRIFGIDPTQEACPLDAAHRLAQERIHPEDWPSLRQCVNHATSEERNFVVEYRIVRPVRDVRYVIGIGYPVLDHAGKLQEMVGTVIDITDRKRVENERREAFDQLRALAARLQNAREEERKRVAREIHDELGQALTAIKIDLSYLRPKLIPEQSARFEPILNAVDQTIKTVRRISTELRPGILDDLGLIAAVEWAAEEFQARTGIRCRMYLPEPAREIDPERATAIFRVFQETMTNVVRHAQATLVDIRLTRQHGAIVLRVRDNGIGIRKQQVSARGSLGILGMRERALLLGGELTLRGIPGKGTLVTLRLPLPSSPEKG
jgi:PAS domain S-box-containing protein